MRAMNAIEGLREQGTMTWTDEEHGWIAAGGHRRCSRKRWVLGMQARDDDQPSGPAADRWPVAGSQSEYGFRGVDDLGESRVASASDRVHHD